MASTVIGGLKINEQLLNTDLIARINSGAEIFNAESNGLFSLRDNRIQGYTPKSSRVIETAGLVSSLDITEEGGSVVDKKVIEETVGGVKVWKKIGPISVTDSALHERGWSPDQFASIVANMFANQMRKSAYDYAVKLLVNAIRATSGAYSEKGDSASPKDVIKAIELYGKNKDLWAGTVLNSKLHAKLLTQGYDDKVANHSFLTIRDESIFSLGRPVLVNDADDLDLSDADASESGNQAGGIMLFLPRGAVEVAIDKQPEIVIDRVSDKEQLQTRFRAEYSEIYYLKEHEWTDAGKNPSAADLADASKWTSRAKEVSQGAGFGYAVEY